MNTLQGMQLHIAGHHHMHNMRPWLLTAVTMGREVFLWHSDRLPNHQIGIRSNTTAFDWYTIYIVYL